MNQLSDPLSLRSYYGPIAPPARRNVLNRLDRHALAFIALSPLVVLATANAKGHTDASPRGDAPGFVRVLDETTLILPDRPGNNRLDSFSNIVTAAGVGLLFFVPGIDETLRVNGRARLLTAPDLLAPSAVDGKLPLVALEVTVEEAFLHCGKALKRASLWDPERYQPRQAFPSFARVIAEQTGVRSVEEGEQAVLES